jgi:hypothetical protein
MIRSIVAIGIAAAALAAGTGAVGQQNSAAPARNCAASDISTIISGMSDKLRKSNVENQSRMQGRLRELAKLKGWSEAETEEKGLELLEDDETRIQDETSSHLLAMVDKLGQTGDSAPPCSQIDELKAVAAQLVEVTSAKAAHVAAKLDNELKSSRTVAAAPTAQPEPKRTPAPAPATTPTAPAPALSASTAPARPAARPSWETQSAVKPNDAYLPPPQSAAPAPLAPPVASIDLAATEFTPDDIRAAGSGVFGTVSAELAAIIDYLFKSYGRPNAYIIGNEGGAALLAGLRYGEGTFVTKSHGERKIYWQGPSAGFDLGLTGSRTLFLVYNLKEPEDILNRFGGIDGSAYFVGGVGVTVMKKGSVILAPIRTGLGLRLGANLGYLRFNTKPRFSPF